MMNPAYDTTLIELLDDLCLESNGAIALIWRNLASDDIHFTYKDIYKEAFKLQGILEKLGVAKKSLVSYAPFESATYCLPAIIIGQVNYIYLEKFKTKFS